MPLPMVHFKTAYSVLNSFTALNIDHSQYYIGSLAPDGVHSRKNYTLYDRNQSHFESKDILQWFENVDRFLRDYKTSSDFSFCLGYAVHVMTDIIWQEKVYNRFHQTYQEVKKTALLNERQIYVNEMCFLDIQIYNTEIDFVKKSGTAFNKPKVSEFILLLLTKRLKKKKIIRLHGMRTRKIPQKLSPT